MRRIRQFMFRPNGATEEIRCLGVWYSLIGWVALPFAWANPNVFAVQAVAGGFIAMGLFALFA